IINPQETQQVTARDEKLVPSAERVKISSTNLRLETTVPQKEETFQVVIDIIKNSTCFKAFTISAHVPKIFMQQFWYTIKKVQGTDSYEFLLANKKCRVDAEVFRKILDICPRVKGEEFTELQNDDNILTFFIDLGYKGPLHKYTNIENVDYLELIWEDLAYQIDHKRDRKSRRENIPYPRFTKEKTQEYRLAISDVMLSDAIKQLESYQMFIKYSTGQIPPKKSRGKGSQGKKTVDDSQETVDVSEESEPEPAKKKTASRRVVKKKVTISADDNIIPDPDIALELGKSISLAEAEEEEATKQVHATYARIVTESVLESAKKKTGSRSSRSVVIQDTPSAPNPKPVTSKPKLKGVQSLTPAKKEDADIMQALKESKKTSKRQPGTGGLSKGTSTVPGVPDESTVVSATSDEGIGIKLGVPDEEKVITKEKIILEWGSEQENEIYKYKIRVRKDKDKEMLNVEVEDSGKGDAEMSDVTKLDAEKTKEAKDDSKKAKLPPTSSSLSVSLGFGDQFLTLPSDTSLIGTVKDTTDAKISSLLNIKIQSDIPHIQSPSMLKVPVSVISEPLVLTPVQETPSAAPLRVAKLENDMFKLKKIDHSAKALATLKSQVPTILKIKKEQAEKQKMPKYTIKSTNKATLKEYHSPYEMPLIRTKSMDKGFADTVKDHKRKHDDDDDDDEDPLAGPKPG
ncbi:hypothetical protein Tco_0930156, partial [Tanacetum coccineum]